ncbi:MAG: hypothetical protein JWO02_1874 [Solirubrobacterales bacterium]|nr:hypothetical protein [Solirubrobacterales bacterium]
MITSAIALLVPAVVAAGVMSGAVGAVSGREGAPAQRQDYADPERGVSALLPAGWHAVRSLTKLGYPREVITLASFRLRRGGSCGPDRALADLPSGGTLIFVLEYRPDRGAVWTDGIRRANFPPRPAHLRLPSGEPTSFECFGKPGYLLRFRDADRPLQVMVALGFKADAARRREVERVLDELRFAPLPPLPPDPYAGWPTLIDESGDSLRVPPRWTSMVTAVPRRLPRPRTLFLSASHRLSGVPTGRRRQVPELPAPGVTPGLGQLSAGAVVLWLTEERRGGPSAAFRPFVRRRPWPTAQDFKDIRRVPVERWPALTWQRAGLSWRGLRFTAWIAAGPKASAQRIALARLAAASVGLSSALRDCSPRNRRGACRRPLPRRLLLRRPPYLGVRCPKANSIACDRVGLTVWLRTPARRLTATIDGRTFTLRPPAFRGGYWEGTLQPAGLLAPGSALHVTPDRGRYFWEGRHPVRVVVRLSATAADGVPAGTSVTVDLRAGYG